LLAFVVAKLARGFEIALDIPVFHIAPMDKFPVHQSNRRIGNLGALPSLSWRIVIFLEEAGLALGIVRNGFFVQIL
jgi:hypothetical protein